MASASRLPPFLIIHSDPCLGRSKASILVSHCMRVRSKSLTKVFGWICDYPTSTDYAKELKMIGFRCAPCGLGLYALAKQSMVAKEFANSKQTREQLRSYRLSRHCFRRE